MWNDTRNISKSFDWVCLLVNAGQSRPVASRSDPKSEPKIVSGTATSTATSTATRMSTHKARPRIWEGPSSDSRTLQILTNHFGLGKEKKKSKCKVIPAQFGEINCNGPINAILWDP